MESRFGTQLKYSEAKLDAFVLPEGVLWREQEKEPLLEDYLEKAMNPNTGLLVRQFYALKILQNSNRLLIEDKVT